MTVPVNSVPSTLNWTLAMVSPVPRVAVADTEMLPETVALAAGAVIEIAVVWLLTVTDTPAEVTTLFALSVATAVMTWLAFVSLVVSSTME